MCRTTGSMSNPPSSAARRVVAVDPGRCKSGIAVVRSDGGCDHHEIVAPEQAPSIVVRLVCEHGAEAVAVGDRTGSVSALEELRRAVGVPVILVDEHRSTEQARRLYFDMVPARGLARLLPRGLRIPPEPIDDYAAWVLGLRYFAEGGP